MIYRSATIEDIEKLGELEEKTFKNPWTKEQFGYEIEENEFSTTLVVYDEDTLVGYITYWVLFDQGEINKVCINEDYRRQGIASILMEKAITDFQKHDCFMLSLEVRASNINAQKLYEKFGFKTVLTKKAYYSDGEDAFYMIKGAY